MAGSKYGSLYAVMTFGESHGPYIGAVIDGVKPGISIDIDEIQREMQRRRPGQSKVSTPRNEQDRAIIVSGVFEGKTTGTPICVLVKNEDQRSKDYSKIAEVVRPGHAAYTYLKKYGIFDFRGGGRASGRETAMRVAAGAIAKQVLREHGIEFYGFVRKIGKLEAQTVDYDFIEKNPVRCPDPAVAAQMETYIRDIAETGDSVGGVVELHIKGLPAGLGDPAFEKLDAELAHGLLSIGATKGIEFGSGFAAAEMLASENNDVFHVNGSGEIVPKTNHAGGLLGGISTGQDVILRLGVKPPSSINKIQHTVNQSGETVPLSVGGRHDPCICPRVVPVAEAMAAIVILDLLLVQQQIQSDVTAGKQSELDVVDAQLALLIKKRMELAKQTGSTSPKHLDDFAEQLGIDKSVLAEIWRKLG
ncbi:MAG: chorismate synthase [Calditrichia bacterium]|nr:chorismate synthase [Calditrichota bacterium]MCB0269890.1 chorismate synthase [Calditrichota bacterium]MCB0285976.1 chorismate synthase [Calditrichota bacterium]MCB9067496.1 chorismate synthase [Calditrichia bacterium]